MCFAVAKTTKKKRCFFEHGSRSTGYMYMYIVYVYVLCICIMYMYYVYVLCLCICVKCAQTYFTLTYDMFIYLETHVSKISGAFPTYKKIRRKSTRMAQCRKHGAIPQKRRNGNSARARTAQSRAKTVQSLAKTAHSNTKI